MDSLFYLAAIHHQKGSIFLYSSEWPASLLSYWPFAWTPARSNVLENSFLSMAKPYETTDQKKSAIFDRLWFYSWEENRLSKSNQTAACCNWEKLQLASTKLPEGGTCVQHPAPICLRWKIFGCDWIITSLPHWHLADTFKTLHNPASPLNHPLVL